MVAGPGRTRYKRNDNINYKVVGGVTFAPTRVRRGFSIFSMF